ncbi:hypothetical protein HOLleu_02027 [Holothuria leucospilota]|uniref:Death domain-containing protein n=1 Tax=Holothuria leucospilota TaxID=206669 RepID=A0A9Q1CPR9_HOLLE|nr:hypothetical protein HOLleu_02027 [Holothuria leucospilota]
MKIPYSWVESSVAETCSFSLQRPQPCTTLPRCVFEVTGNPVQPKYRLTVNFRSLQPPAAEKTVVTDDALFTLSHQIQDVWEDIGRRLQLPETDLNNTLNEKSSRQEKACKMLIAWKKRVGQVAFAEVLEGALGDEHRHDLIDALRKAMQSHVPENPVPTVDPRGKHPLEASAVISKDGGVVQISDTGVELHIPRDAFQGFFKSGLTIQLRILPHHVYDGPAKRFEDHSTVMVEVLPNDLELKRSARLFLPHCLKLNSAIHSEVRIFKGHHNADKKQLWEDITTSVTYSLSRSYCEIRMKRFCWIKYTIRGQVKAKTLKLYTKVKKFDENAASVTVDVGCYPSLPGGKKATEDSEASQADFLGDERDFCFLKEPQKDLHISLAKRPGGWKSNDPPKHEIIIPYRTIQNSIETNCHFLFKWDGRTSVVALCEFEVFQDKQQLLTHLSMTFAPQLVKPSMLEHRVVTDSQLSDLSAYIGPEWKHIGRYLQITEESLYCILGDVFSRREQVFQMLLTWKRQNGRRATIDVLARALRNVGRRDLEERLTETDLSDYIGIEWGHIRRYLEITEDSLCGISDDLITHQEQVYQMLLTWKRQNGRRATKDVLAGALRHVGRRDLEEKLTETDLSDYIGSELKDIGRYLEVTEESFYGFSDDLITHREQVYQMLLTWKRQNGRRATKDVLARALCNVGRRDLRERLTETDLSDYIGSEWEDIGRYLEGTEESLYCFSDDLITHREHVYRMLLKWKRQNGWGATIDVLARALRNVGRRDLEERLTETVRNSFLHLLN